MKLFIDSREKSLLTECIIAKVKKNLIQYEKVWMEVGDYVIGDVCFEAKSVEDFIQSVLNRRIWVQLSNMEEHFNKNFVIIHGSLEKALKATKYMGGDTARNKVRFSNAFKGGIGRIRLDYNAEVILCRTPQEAADHLVTLAKMIPVERKIIDPRLLKRVATIDVRLDALMTVKGVSKVKAEQLLEKFGCIIEIANSTIDELTIIEGIGRVIASRIITVFNSNKKVKQ